MNYFNNPIPNIAYHSGMFSCIKHSYSHNNYSAVIISISSTPSSRRGEPWVAASAVGDLLKLVLWVGGSRRYPQEGSPETSQCWGWKAAVWRERGGRREGGKEAGLN